ncbi:MAG: hypothetical protein PUE67_04990 [Oscillospiraceae bacterium]|nr:hypothetical protein [Oscillospiraceae bacterium]
MSDNRKPPYDDDKTRVFNIKDKLNDKGLNDDERDFFSDDPIEDINTFATQKIDLRSSSAYNDDFDINSHSQKQGVTSYNDDFDNFNEIPERTDRNMNKRPVNHKKPPKKSKKPVVIGVACGAVAIVIVVVILLAKGFSNSNSPVDTSTTTESTSETAVSTSQENTSYEDTSYIETTAEETTELTSETTEETTIPPTTEKPTIANLFDASFAPYKCITPDGEVVSDDFNSVLGGDASVSFTSDGSYSLAVGSVANSSGSYSVDGNYLGMDGYSGTVNFDDAGNPVAVIIEVDGYQVYFN